MNSKIYKTLINVSIVSLFILVGILILAFTKSIPFTPIMVDILSILAIICLSSINILPWLKNLINNKNKVTSIIFIVFTCVVALLWCIAIPVTIGGFLSETSSDAYLINLLKYIKICFILTLQLITSSIIARTTLRYKKNYIAFQVIMYLSYIFLDFWLTTLLLSLTFIEGSLVVAPAINFLFSKEMIVSLSIAFVYTVLSNSIIRAIDGRALRNAAEKALANEEIKEDKLDLTQVKEKLDGLKELYIQDLITAEEYNKRKEELLSKI